MFQNGDFVRRKSGFGGMIYFVVSSFAEEHKDTAVGTKVEMGDMYCAEWDGNCAYLYVKAVWVDPKTGAWSFRDNWSEKGTLALSETLERVEPPAGVSVRFVRPFLVAT